MAAATISPDETTTSLLQDIALSLSAVY